VKLVSILIWFDAGRPETVWISSIKSDKATELNKISKNKAKTASKTF
jgi:hypothetical protein